MTDKQPKISAKAPVVGGKQYHIACGPGDVAPSVLLPGDPERVAKIASAWNSANEIAFHREYRTMTGRFRNTPISCTSTGIGAPSLAIAVDELSRIGVDTFIRVGSCGGLRREHHIGDLIISTAAVRLDGASRDFVIPEYPAFASYEVVMALIQSAEELKVRYHVGVTASTDTFYTGQGRPGLNNYLPSFKQDILADMQRANVQNFEMESSCLFTLASIFGKRAGTVCFVVANRVTDEFNITDTAAIRAGKVATLAVKILADWEKVKKKKGKKYLYPEML